jgi:hypothetical protein
MLEKPESAGPVRPEDAAKKVAQSHEAGQAEPKEAEAATQERDDERDDDDIDQDIYLLLFCAKPLLQSRNPSVVLGTVRLFYHLAPASHPEISQQLLVQPLLRLVDGLVRPEIASLAVEVCQEVAEERPVSVGAFQVPTECEADRACIDPIVAFHVMAHPFPTAIYRFHPRETSQDCDTSTAHIR